VIEAIVFDLDGTLVGFPINYETLFEEFRRIMGVREVHPVVEVVSRTDGKTRELVFNAWDRAELAVASNTLVNEEGMKTYIEFLEKPKALVTLQGKRLPKLSWNSSAWNLTQSLPGKIRFSELNSSKSQSLSLMLKQEMSCSSETQKVTLPPLAKQAANS